MSPETQNTIDELFEKAIQLDEAGRKDFLDAACADLPNDVKKKVEALIDADQSCESNTEPFLNAAQMNVGSARKIVKS